MTGDYHDTENTASHKCDGFVCPAVGARSSGETASRLYRETSATVVVAHKRGNTFFLFISTKMSEPMQKRRSRSLFFYSFAIFFLQYLVRFCDQNHMYFCNERLVMKTLIKTDITARLDCPSVVII